MRLRALLSALTGGGHATATPRPGRHAAAASLRAAYRLHVVRRPTVTQQDGCARVHDAPRAHDGCSVFIGRLCRRAGSICPASRKADPAITGCLSRARRLPKTSTTAAPAPLPTVPAAMARASVDQLQHPPALICPATALVAPGFSSHHPPIPDREKLAPAMTTLPPSPPGHSCQSYVVSTLNLELLSPLTSVSSAGSSNSVAECNVCPGGLSLAPGLGGLARVLRPKRDACCSCLMPASTPPADSLGG